MDNIIQILYVGIGGFLGAIGRFLVSKAAGSIAYYFPLGTLIVNVTGSFFLAFLLYSLIIGKQVSPELRSFVAIGFLGAFTTMSTFSYETVRLFQVHSYLFGFLNLVSNIVLSIGAVFLGRAVALLVFR